MGYVIGLTDEIVHRTITIRKSKRIKLPDAIIAATAMVHDLTIVTRNISDFERLQGLKTLNPWEALPL